jgi:hypothetical protein
MSEHLHDHEAPSEDQPLIDDGDGEFLDDGPQDSDDAPDEAEADDEPDEAEADDEADDGGED